MSESESPEDLDPATREHRALKSQTLPLIGAKNEDFWRLMLRDEESISYCTKQSDCPDDFLIPMLIAE